MRRTRAQHHSFKVDLSHTVPARKTDRGKLYQEETFQAGGMEQNNMAGRDDCGHFYERGELDAMNGSATSVFVSSV